MRSTLLPALALALAAMPVTAQQTTTTAPRVSQTSLTPNRDVILEIPELSVDSIGLTVSNLRAHVSLDANAMNFVTLNAGVDVGIKQVQLGLVGVFAEAYLYVDLDNVARIVARVVQTLDRNPQILTQVLKTVETAATSIAGPPPRP
jgi:transcriptional accessory protein Tex/SPT6